MNTDTYLSCHALSHPTPTFEPQSIGEIEDARGETKIELVELPDDGSGPKLQLVEYSWGSGLGWYVRKRLTLDSEQGAGLAALLTAAVAPALPSTQPLKTRQQRPLVEENGKVIRLFAPADEAPNA